MRQTFSASADKWSFMRRELRQIKPERINLLPYPVEHLVMPGSSMVIVGTYSSPTLAAFVDAIAAQLVTLGHEGEVSGVLSW